MTSKVMLGLVLSLVLSVSGTLPWVYAGSHQAAATAQDGKININTASKTELMKLKGVGRELAEKIIEYREKNGPFAKPEDIRKITGIGKGIWEANRETITVK
jgi:competence protein ComEA